MLRQETWSFAKSAGLGHLIVQIMKTVPTPNQNEPRHRPVDYAAPARHRDVPIQGRRRAQQPTTELPKNSSEDFKPIASGVTIGHVHLKVADLERALGFYCDVLGFQLTQYYGPDAAFISAGGYHHHIGLNTWESAGGVPPPAGSTGLYHMAILYPRRVDLADALRRVLAAGIELEGASDHGVSEAIYLRDPDRNGVELYWDKPKEQWPRTLDGKLDMVTRSLDLDDLAARGMRP